MQPTGMTTHPKMQKERQDPPGSPPRLTFRTPRSRAGVMSSPCSARAAACTSPSLLVASSVVMVSLHKPRTWGDNSAHPVRPAGPREVLQEERVKENKQSSLLRGQGRKL